MGGAAGSGMAGDSVTLTRLLSALFVLTFLFMFFKNVLLLLC